MTKIYLEERRMTFGEHLDELRRRIILSILFLVLGIVFALIFLQDPLFKLVLRPHQIASKQRAYQVVQKKFSLANNTFDEVLKKLPTLSPEICYALLPELKRKQLLEEDLKKFYKKMIQSMKNNSSEKLDEETSDLALRHVDIINKFISQELVKSDVNKNISVRLERDSDRFNAVMKTYGSNLRNFFKIRGIRGKSNAEMTEDYFPVLLKELQSVEKRAVPVTLADQKTAQSQADKLAIKLNSALTNLEDGIKILQNTKLSKIVALKYTEQFFSYLKIVLIFGFFISSPLILYQVWRFIGAGLYTHEQKVAITFVPFSFMLFISGTVFGYFVLVPVGLSYLSSYGDPELVSPMLNLSAYLSLFFTLTLLLGLVFQVPLIMFFLSRTGMVKPKVFARIRKQAILAGFIIGAVLTPPDPFTQLMMAVPLILLYEIGIWVSKIAYIRVKKEDEQSDSGD